MQLGLVRFAGTLLPVEGKGTSDLNTLTVFIRDQAWLFRLDKVETLAGTNLGWMILNDIFPPELRFAGPADLLRFLQAAESVSVHLSNLREC